MSQPRSNRSRRNRKRYGVRKDVKDQVTGWRGKPKPITVRSSQDRAERDDSYPTAEDDE